MIVFILALVIVGLLGAVYISYKKSGDKKELAISIMYLATIISLGIVGRVMHSISALYLAQYIALIVAFFGFLYFLFRKRFIWWSLLAPVAVLILYMLLANYAGSGTEVIVQP